MITPLDIKKHEFTQKFRGYDPDEVRALLDSIAKEFEELNHANAQLSERLKVSEERVNHYRLIEKTLQDAVITMQQTLEEKVKSADKESELIVQQARHKADEEMRSSREHIATLRAEIYTLENQKRQFFIRFRNMLRSQSEMLAALIEADDGSGSETIATSKNPD